MINAYLMHAMTFKIIKAALEDIYSDPAPDMSIGGWINCRGTAVRALNFFLAIIYLYRYSYATNTCIRYGQLR